MAAAPERVEVWERRPGAALRPLPRGARYRRREPEGVEAPLHSARTEEEHRFVRDLLETRAKNWASRSYS
jgi:hypothetical protein